MQTAENKTQVTTTGGKVRFSYANILEPKANQQGELKYSVSLLIRKDDKLTVDLIKAAIKAAIAHGVEKVYKGKNPAVPSFKNPLRDGDLERPEDEVYAGCYFINANSNRMPVVAAANGRPVQPLDLTEEHMYSGCYGNASVNFFPFNYEGTIGVGCGLNGVQKVRDGERLAGIPDPNSMFSAVESEDDSLWL